MAVFFLDNDQKVIKIVPDDGAISILQTQELPESDGLLKDTLYVRLKNDQRLFDAQYMAVKSYGDNRNAFDLYRIVNEIVPDNATEFEGVQLAPYELEGVVIEDLRPQNRPLNQMMNQLLENTDWRLGYMDDNLPAVSTNFYYVSVKDALKKIQDLLNIEFLFKVEISGNEITDKWVEVYREVGNRTLKRFNYGTNALTVKRETSSNELYTALIGRGKGEEVSSAEDNPGGQAGYGRKITFEDVEWSRENGDPADKPKGQKYIESPQATEEYGIKLIDGRKVPRVGVVEFSDTEEPEVLINQTWQELQYYARPRVLFSTTVAKIGGTSIGDTVTIHRHDLNMHYMTRVRKVVRNRKNDKQTQLEIGDVVHTPSTKRQSNVNSALSNVTSDLENVRGEITIAKHSADGKNTNFYGNAEPERKKVGDTWFRDHPSLTGESQILVWNGEAWELIMDTSETTKNADAIEEQQKEIDLAKEVADEALSEIDIAIRNAGFTSLDDTIKNVQSRANTAFDTANDLIGEVSGYSQTVSGFNQTVNNYTNQVANFRSDVDGFSSTVASYSSDVRGYATQVSTLTNRVDGFNSTVANIDGRVTTLSTSIDGLSSTVSGHGNRISAVEQTASGLQTTVASKANQSQVTQLSNAYNIFVGGIEDRKNLLPGMESGGLYSNTGNEYDSTSYIRSPYIPIKYSGAYIVSLNGSPISHNLYQYTDIGEFHSSTGYSSQNKFVGSEIKYIRILIITSNPNLKYQLEKGYSPTDYVPFIGDVSSAQISMLQNNINLRVTSTELNNAVSGKADKNRLITQINLSSDTALIQSENILLDGDVTIRGTAWMDGAVLKNLSVDGAKIQDATIGDAKIANLDADKITTGTIRSHILENTGIATFTSVDSRIEDINVGTRNYLLNSDKMVNTGSQSFSLSVDPDVFRNKKVTISIDVDLEGGYETSGDHQRIGYEGSITYADGTRHYLGVWHHLADGKNFKGRIHRTLQVQDKEVQSFTNRVYIQLGGTKTYVGNPKLTIGTKGADWTPAPEDNPTKNELASAGQTVIHGENISTGTIDASRVNLRDSSRFEWTLEMKSGNLQFVDRNNRRAGGVFAFVDPATQNPHSIALTTQSGYYATISYPSSGTTDQYLTALRVRGSDGHLEAYRDLNMNGFKVTNTSDKRFKKNIREHSESSLEAIGRWDFIDFEYRKYTDPSTPAPKGEFMGLIAQDTPEIKTYDEESDVYGIDTTKMTMMNSHAIQEVNTKVETNEQKIQRLENRIEELEEQII